MRLARKVEERLNKGGVAKRVLPPSFAVPALEGAASVDDDSVPDMWAALLASGVKDDGAQRPAYVQTLKSIGGTEAAVLQQIIRGGGLYDTRKFAMASVPDWERAAVMLLQSLGVLAPVIDVRPRDAGPNRYEFSADAYILEVAPYGWDFAGAVAPEVVAWSTREVYRPKNAHHFTPRFE